MKRFVTFLPFLLIVILIQWLGTSVTMSEIPTWYASLNQPAWSPPNWVFGPVWTMLYLFIAVAGYRVWRALSPRTAQEKFKHPAMRCYAWQLIANAVWSPLFFGMHRADLALADILVLLGFILLCLYHFKKLDRVSFWLFVPYALWVAYASTVNAGVVGLNG